jgi:hypothetical protein
MFTPQLKCSLWLEMLLQDLQEDSDTVLVIKSTSVIDTQAQLGLCKASGFIQRLRGGVAGCPKISCGPDPSYSASEVKPNNKSEAGECNQSTQQSGTIEEIRER